MENIENTPDETEEVKKSNLLNYIALAIVIFFAGYYILNAGNTGDDNDDTEVEVIDEEELPDGKGGDAGLLTAGKYGEEGELNVWKNYEGNFTLAALSDWEVHQINAGPVRIVEVYHPDNTNESVTLWLQAANMDFEDIQITFNDWVVGSTQNMTEVKECAQSDIGGLSMACRMGYIGDEYWLMYFGELNENLFTGVFKPVEESSETLLWDVIDGVNFEPSDSELEGAILIP